tara:strand:- start:1224 stop:1787 length:564 start_codon:yes stop_codon:yes gene_type:complete
MDEEIINKPKFNFSDFFKKNKFKIFSTIALIIVTIFILIILNEYQKKRNIDISEKFNTAKILIEKKNSGEATQILEDIVLKKNTFYSPSALNLIVDNNLIKDKTKVLSFFDHIISINKLDLETKNLFIFKKIIFIGDDINENELLSSLKPIMQSNSLWKNTVSNYIKKYYLSKGELNKAKNFDISNN